MTSLKRLISIALSSAITFGISGTFCGFKASAEIDNAPIIGEFQYKEEWQKIIEEKEKTAIAYNTAIENKNYLLASEIAKESNLGFPQNTSVMSTQPTFKRLGNLGQRPQQTDFWCGYAALESLLDYDYSNMQQSYIAEVTYSKESSCPWYKINGNSIDQFPAVTTLRKYIDYSYVPYPYGNADSTTLTGNDIEWRIRTTICNEHGLLACGTSRSDVNADSHLPHYPAKDITHWVAIDGYGNSGDRIYIVDPAKSDAVSWSDNISALYYVTSDKLAAFASSRGIIW